MVYNLELKVFPELRNLSSDGQSNVVFDVSSCHLFEVDDVVLAVLMALAEGVDDVEVSELLAPKFDKSAVDSALAGIAGSLGTSWPEELSFLCGAQCIS